MTVGLLGGAFDPPHNGHLVLADVAVSHFDLELLVVVPTGDPPHKPVETPADVRYRLAEAAFAGRPGVELSRYEVDAEGPSYSERTAAWARSRFGDVVFVIGADEFSSFLAWHDPNGVLAEVRLGVATRPGYPHGRLDAVLAQLDHPERVELFAIPDMPVSSTDVRDRVARGAQFDELVPEGVARLIRELNLYGATAPHEL